MADVSPKVETGRVLDGLQDAQSICSRYDSPRDISDEGTEILGTRIWKVVHAIVRILALLWNDGAFPPFQNGCLNRVVY